MKITNTFSEDEPDINTLTETNHNMNKSNENENKKTENSKPKTKSKTVKKNEIARGYGRMNTNREIDSEISTPSSTNSSTKNENKSKNTKTRSKRTQVDTATDQTSHETPSSDSEHIEDSDNNEDSKKSKQKSKGHDRFVNNDNSQSNTQTHENTLNNENKNIDNTPSSSEHINRTSNDEERGLRRHITRKKHWDDMYYYLKHMIFNSCIYYQIFPSSSNFNFTHQYFLHEISPLFEFTILMFEFSPVLLYSQKQICYQLLDLLILFCFSRFG